MTEIVWPDRLDDVDDSARCDLVLADPARYMAQARAETREWAEYYVAERLAAERAKRDARRRAQPWWSWRRWWV